MAGKPEGYEEVADRIHRFYKEYPEGSIQTAGWEVVTVGSDTFIVAHALVHRNPQDQLPGTGYAWEAYPGRTPFTRGSELMNAETSAWGRGLASIGMGGRKIATQDEVASKTTKPDLSDKALEFRSWATKEKIPAEKIKLTLGAMGVSGGSKALKTVIASLTDEQITLLREKLS